MKDLIPNGKKRFCELDGKRSTMLNDYEKFSKLTLPYVCPEVCYQEQVTKLQNEVTGFGYKLVNNLVSKLNMNLFSPSRPFFKLVLSDKIKSQAYAEGMEQALLDELLSKQEMRCVSLFETLNLRPITEEAIANLIVLGTALVKLDKKGNHINYNIRDYVLRRSQNKKCNEFLTREKVIYNDLSKDLKEFYISNCKQTNKINNEEEEIEIYTWYKRNSENKRWESTQYLDDVKLPAKYDGGWKEEDFPFLILSWVLPSGQNYGTGQVQLCYGDFLKHRQTCMAETELSVLVSQHRFLLAPGSSLDPVDVANARNGEVLSGGKDDLQAISLVNGSNSNIQYIMQIKAQCEMDLSKTFLMNVARDAERVTAEEIRANSYELNTQLSSVYTNIAEQMQKPIARFLFKNLEDGLKIGNNEIEPMIVTGVDSLSRSGEVENIVNSLSVLANLTNLPPILLEKINLTNLSKKILSGFGVSGEEFLLSEEQIAANEQAKIASQMAGADGPAGGSAPVATPPV